jgi:hypothetical protein
MASWVERNVVNRAVRLGTRLGRDIDRVRELEVRGGSSGWVENLRAAGTARLRFGRSVEDDAGRGAAGMPMFRLTVS